MPDSPRDSIRRSLLVGDIGQETGDREWQSDDFQVIGGPMQGASPSPLEATPILPCPVPTHPVPPPHTSSPPHTRCHLPCNAAPMASSVRSRTLPQLRPASQLVTQQSRAAFLPVAICTASGVWPSTAMKKRKMVPECSSSTGQGFMDLCSSSTAVSSTVRVPH